MGCWHSLILEVRTQERRMMMRVLRFRARAWKTGNDPFPRIADGFVVAIDICANELAAHFPRAETSKDELPNRIYLI